MGTPIGSTSPTTRGRPPRCRPSSLACEHGYALGGCSLCAGYERKALQAVMAALATDTSRQRHRQTGRGGLGPPWPFRRRGHARLGPPRVREGVCDARPTRALGDAYTARRWEPDAWPRFPAAPFGRLAALKPKTFGLIDRNHSDPCQRAARAGGKVPSWDGKRCVSATSGVRARARPPRTLACTGSETVRRKFTPTSCARRYPRTGSVWPPGFPSMAARPGTRRSAEAEGRRRVLPGVRDQCGRRGLPADELVTNAFEYAHLDGGGEVRIAVAPLPEDGCG